MFPHSQYSPYSSIMYPPLSSRVTSVKREPVRYYEGRRPLTQPVTYDSFFKIVIVLDESGSMSPIKENMCKAINDLIKEQKQIKDRPATFTLVKFNDKVNRVIKNKPLDVINELTSNDYNPNGATALYDCIGDTIEWFRNEKDVLMVIVTDGQENASRSFTKSEVNIMIEDKKRTNNWSYVYLSNDLTTAMQGDNIGLRNSDYSTNAVLERQHFGSYLGNTLNTAISNYRTKGQSVQQQLNS